MPRSRYAVLIFVIFSLILYGCAPTYPKEHITESVEKLVKKEKGLDVKAYLNGRTLTVYIPVDSLVSEDVKVSDRGFEIIDDIDFILRRVALSTDCSLQFLRVAEADEKDTAYEVTVIRNVEDVKRFRYMDISRGEASKRVHFNIGLNPCIEGIRAIRARFGDMNDSIISMRTLRVDEETALIYVNSATGTHLFTAGRDRNPGIINEDADSLPRIFSKYGDPETWPDTYADISDVRLEWFLAKEMASRIKETLNRYGDFTVYGVEGRFEERNFYFKIDIFPMSLEKDIYESIDGAELLSAYAISYIVHGYGFKDFDYVKIDDSLTKGGAVIRRDELEDKYYKRSKKLMRDI